MSSSRCKCGKQLNLSNQSLSNFLKKHRECYEKPQPQKSRILTKINLHEVVKCKAKLQRQKGHDKLTLAQRQMIATIRTLDKVAF